MAKGGASLSPYYEFEDKIPSAVKTQVASLAMILLQENCS